MSLTVPLRFSSSPTAIGSGSSTVNTVGENTVKIVVEFDPRMNSSPWNDSVTSLGPRGISEGTGKNRLNEPFASTLSEVNICPFMKASRVLFGSGLPAPSVKIPSISKSSFLSISP